MSAEEGEWIERAAARTSAGGHAHYDDLDHFDGLPGWRALYPSNFALGVDADCGLAVQFREFGPNLESGEAAGHFVEQLQVPDPRAFRRGGGSRGPARFEA